MGNFLASRSLHVVESWKGATIFTHFEHATLYLVYGRQAEKGQTMWFEFTYSCAFPPERRVGVRSSHRRYHFKSAPRCRRAKNSCLYLETTLKEELSSFEK